MEEPRRPAVEQKPLVCGGGARVLPVAQGEREPLGGDRETPAGAHGQRREEPLLLVSAQKHPQDSQRKNHVRLEELRSRKLSLVLPHTLRAPKPGQLLERKQVAVSRGRGAQGVGGACSVARRQKREVHHQKAQAAQHLARKNRPLPLAPRDRLLQVARLLRQLSQRPQPPRAKAHAP